MVSGFQAMLVFAVWLVVVVAYGLIRSLGEARQDPIRPAGPLD
jgi:hypothetical protein